MDESTQPDKAAPEENTSDPGLAYRTLLDHVTSCEHCRANWRTCQTRRRLSDLLRQVRS